MDDTNPTQYPAARQTGLVIQEIQDEVLVYDLATNEAHCLNRSAAIVWSACDGKNSVQDIARQFESNGQRKVTEDFVWLAIDRLSETGLLKNEITPRFDRRSRRQILKSIGLASVVSIPVIASIIAPNHAFASVNCHFTSSAQCATMTTCPSTTNCNQLSMCAPDFPSQNSQSKAKVG